MVFANMQLNKPKS